MNIIAMFQLNLQFSNNKDSLKDYFEKAADKAISLTLTDNYTSMLSVKTRGNSVFIRLHWMFLHAGNDVIREIAEFIKKRRNKTPLISRFIRENKHCLKNKSSRPLAVCTHGKYHNLKELFNSLNEEYFRGKITALITWGKKNSNWAVRKRTLGSFCSHTNIIRINPVLDRKNIPQYFLKFVIYHEMLHSHIPVEAKNARRVFHSAEFRKMERLFEDYKKALVWEKRH
jgi:predicted metal-dependent hydrolase